MTRTAPPPLLLVALAVLAVLGGLGLAVPLRFPEVLLDDAPFDGAHPTPATVSFVAVGVVVPLLLAAWTLAVQRRPLAVGGAVGLVLTAARSVVWAIDAHQPAGEGSHVVSAVLTVLALLGFPLWIAWLVAVGLGVRSRVGVALLAVGIVLAHAGASVAAAPVPRTAAVPAVPSAGGALFYSLALVLSGSFALPADRAALQEARAADRYTRLVPPAGATLDEVDVGVPADHLCAPGASRDRAVLYLHGGGFVMPVSNGSREFAVTLSRETGACVLLPHYRLAPEHPFPAAVQDSAGAYRWLGSHGVEPSRTVIVGDSAGGTLALAAAVALRDGGEEPPAAVVALSPGTDLTLAGETHRTRAGVDPLLGSDDVRFSADSYLGGADPRDPVVSPLFAEPAGLPPTLLLAGSQEVLLSDAVRMADRLRTGGVAVQLEVWPGMPHDWPVVIAEIPESGWALGHIAAFVVRHGG